MSYKSLNEVESVIALGKPMEVVDVFLESYLQGLEYAKWCEGKDIDETVDTIVTDEEGNDTTVSTLVNVYELIDVSEAMAQWKKQNYSILRKSAYPPIAEFVDAHVKNDDVALKAYVDKCLEVKAKYPK